MNNQDKNIFASFIIATDLDGTFLGKSSRMVKRNLEAIEYFKAHGGRFTFATGRVWTNLLLAVPEAGEICNIPAIICNGACMYDFDRKELVNCHSADKQIIKAAALFARKTHPEVGIRVCTSKGCLTDGETDLIKNDLRIYNEGDVRIIPIPLWETVASDDDWYKTVYRGTPDALITLRMDIEAEFGDAFEYANSSPVFFETNGKGCTKASAVRELARMYGDGKTKIVCCGDYENDIAMLRAADISVCPGDAQEQVRKICTYVLCSHDDGIFGELVPILEQLI